MSKRLAPIGDPTHVECYLTPDAFHPCAFMEVRLVDKNAPGFHRLWQFDTQTGACQVRGIVYKRTARDQNALVRFCPWCGAKLHADDGQPIYRTEAASMAEKETRGG